MMIRRVARSFSSKSPPSNWFLKRSISPPIPFSRSPPSTNLADEDYSEIDVNIMALFRPHTGDSIVKYPRLGRLQDSSKLENAKRKPIFYVHRVSRGYTVLTPISLEDDGSLSNKYSISNAFDIVLDPPIYYSCNGLFCYRDITCDDHDLFVWNPTTMETRKLPISPHNFEPPTNDPHGRLFNKVTVPFDSLTKVDTFVATWADPESEDYKLLRYYTFHDYTHVDSYESCDNFGPTQLELYSLKTDSWKKLCWKGGPDSGISSCYIDGVIYMLTNNRRRGIVSFDFRTETFSTIPFPTHVCPVSSFELVNCNGQLNLLCFRCKSPYSLVDMTHWVMSNGEWDYVSRYHDVPGVLRPLGFARNGELLLFLSAAHWEPKIHSSLMVFDSTTGVIKHLPGLASRCDINLFNFAETFIKLKPSGEQEKEDGRANAIQEQVVKLKAFSKFENTAEALSAATLLIDSKPSKGLRKFPRSHCDGDVIAVADFKLGNIIKEKLVGYSGVLPVFRKFSSSYHSQARHFNIIISEYELHDLLFPQNCGAGEFEIAYSWPFSYEKAPHFELKRKFYLHGPRFYQSCLFSFDWSCGSTSMFVQRPSLSNFFKTCGLSVYHVIQLWPDLMHPSSVLSCESFVHYQWKKHGMIFYIGHVEYVKLGMYFAETFQDDFGITPGLMMTKRYLINTVQKSICQKLPSETSKKLRNFNLGNKRRKKDVYCNINANYPKRNFKKQEEISAAASYCNFCQVLRIDYTQPFLHIHCQNYHNPSQTVAQHLE